MPWWSRASASNRAKSLLGLVVAEEDDEEEERGRGDGGGGERLRLWPSAVVVGDAAGLSAEVAARRATERVTRALLDDDEVLLIDGR